MPTSMTSYPSRLDSAQRQIRLLTLRPGVFPFPIRCTLSNVMLSDSPQYDALSYAWGDENDCKGIYLNGKWCLVTRSVKIALKYLRHPREQRTLWIDALCIHQADVVERNEQVRMMADIYSSATTVLIWIGEADDWSNAAFDAVVSDSPEPTEEEERKETIVSFLSLGVRPWFSRLWVLQEMALAKQDPIVHCGHKHRKWSLFARTWDLREEDFWRHPDLNFTSFTRTTSKGSNDMPRVTDFNNLRQSLIDDHGLG